MAIRRNHIICGALGAPPGTLYPVRATTRCGDPAQCGVDADKTTHLLCYAHFGGEHIVFFWGVAMESVFDGIQFYFLIWNCRNDISRAP